MEKMQRSQVFLRKRRMFMVVPLLVLPFLTMAFWALGGGKGEHSLEKRGKIEGLNVNLPDPHLKDDKREDKLSFYDKAAQDSLKRTEWMKSDPYYRKRSLESSVPNDLHAITEQTASKYKQNL